jgi:FkbM family methyltransferase
MIWNKKITRRSRPALISVLSQMTDLVLPPRYVMPLRDKFGGARDAEIDLLGSFVFIGTVALDIGAHIGTYTYKLSKLVGPNGRVYAFEPQPRSFSYLAGVFRNKKNVYLINSAVSDACGKVQFWVPIRNNHSTYGNAGGTMRERHEGYEELLVDSLQLDSFDFPVVSFIKIDTEGNELKVLKGARKLIAKDLPVVMIEILAGTSQVNSAEIWNMMNAEFGYSCFHVENNELSITEKDKYLGSIETRSLDRSFNYIFCQI